MWTPIEYEGFSPDSNLKSLAKEMLAKLERKAPSQSSHKTSIEKVGNDFRGKLLISSTVGCFGTDLVGPSPNFVLSEMYKKTAEELLQWKKGRILERNVS